MKTAVTLSDLREQVGRRAKARLDFANVGARTLGARVDTHHGRVIDMERSPQGAFYPNGRFDEQMASALKIPMPYYRRMVQDAPNLWAENVNTWLRARDESHLVRLLWGADDDVDLSSDPAVAQSRDGIARLHVPTGRALLSNRYKMIDADLMLAAALPALMDLGEGAVDVKSCALTSDNLYLQVVFPQLAREVSRPVGDRRLDMVSAGCVVRTNETGSGSAGIEYLIYWKWCSNGAITHAVEKKRHVGGSLESLGLDAVSASHETLQLQQATIRSAMRDAIKLTHQDATIDAAVAQIESAGEEEIPRARPAEMVKQLRQLDSGLGEPEMDSILAQLTGEGDFTRRGMSNAITATANESEDYERAVGLERLGGAVLFGKIPAPKWNAVLAAGAV